MEGISGTPEQMFAIMMKERIDKLEDTLLNLQDEIQNLHKAVQNTNASMFHYIVLELKSDCNEDDEDEELEQDTIDACLDEMFKNRNVYEPTFAAWHVYGKIFKLAIVLNEPLSGQELIRLLQSDMYNITRHKCPDISLFKWLFYGNFEHIVCDNDDNDAIFFPSNNSYIEYWWRHTTDFETDCDFNPYMTQQPFTKSDNYGRSASVQRFLKEKIYKHHDWSELLRLHYIF